MYFSIGEVFDSNCFKPRGKVRRGTLRRRESTENVDCTNIFGPGAHGFQHLEGQDPVFHGLSLLQLNAKCLDGYSRIVS